MVENFGSYLKHERELRGVPLEEIAGVTKIHIRFLEALEANHFEELPGEVFVKGYIRSYAKTIGSDVDELLNAYGQFIEQNPGGSSQINQAGNYAKMVSEKQTYGGYIAVGILLLVIASGGYYLTSKTANEKETGKTNVVVETSPVSTAGILNDGADILPDTTGEIGLPEDLSSEETQVSVDKEKSPENTGVEKEVSRAVAAVDSLGASAEFSTAEPENSPAKQKAIQVLSDESSDESSELARVSEAVPADDPQMTLAIRVSEDSWFNLTVDDFREEDFILPAGTGKSFLGNNKFRITIGNRNGVKLTLNGQALALPEGSGNVVKDFIINHQNTE